VSFAQKANEQLATERARVPAAVIDVEKPETDINGRKFVEKGPRDHKAFCEQVFKTDKKRGAVKDWVVDVGWQDK
jgi:hypothetical protein